MKGFWYNPTRKCFQLEDRTVKDTSGYDKDFLWVVEALGFIRLELNSVGSPGDGPAPRRL